MILSITSIFLYGCSIQSSVETPNQPKLVPITKVSNPPGAIFPKESIGNHQKGFEGVGIATIGLWNPSIEEAKKADQIVKECIANKEKIAEDKIKYYSEENKAKEKEKNFILACCKKLSPSIQTIYVNMLATVLKMAINWSGLISFCQMTQKDGIGKKK